MPALPTSHAPPGASIGGGGMHASRQASVRTLLAQFLRALLPRRFSSRRAVAFFLRSLLYVSVLCAIDVLVHVHVHVQPLSGVRQVGLPEADLDGPFAARCRDPTAASREHAREKATFVMLARNGEVEEAQKTMEWLEKKFNRWFHYPVLFLNDEAWDEGFVRRLNGSVSGGARFEVLGREERGGGMAAEEKQEEKRMDGNEGGEEGGGGGGEQEGEWGFPSWMNEEEVEAAREAVGRQEGKKGNWNGGMESYHHMCRFFSGKFYNLDALKDYKWYWRIEPGVRYTCAITYDPFVEMARREKVYGYTVALWEEPKTCPGLFRAVDDYRVDKGIPAGPMWNAMVDASWKPWPLRKLMAWLRAAHTDGNGDGWNLCHYWSNFEIADLDFFRGERYQELFGHLDRSGGFYDERWGDAPVHSLAVHLLLEPGKLHHFSDIGYDHKPFYQCPGNAPGGQLEEEELEKSIFGEGKYSPETEGTIGCRCECNHHRKKRNNRAICLGRLQEPATAAANRMGFMDRFWGRYPYAIGVA